MVTHNATALSAPERSWWTSGKELERIAKEKKQGRGESGRASRSKLQNESFVSKAPEAVVNAEREKADKARALIAKLEESAAAMRD